MANITRDTFGEDKLVVKKIFQDQTPGVDADFNEQGDINRYALMRALSSMVGYADKRFGDGFKVIQKGENNTVTIKAGLCAVHIADKLAINLRLATDTDFDTFTTPSGSDRTDYLYLDIYFEEIDSTEDPNLTLPSRGQESAIDYRLKWSFEKSEGSTPDDPPPAGHTFVSIAQIERQDSDPTIVTADITNLLENFNAVLKNDMDGTLDGSLTVNDNLLVKGTSEFQDNVTLSADKTIDGIDPSKLGRVVWAMDLRADYHGENQGDVVAWVDGPPYDPPFWETTAGAVEKKLIKGHIKFPNINFVRIRSECGGGGSSSSLRMTINGSYVDLDASSSSYSVQTSYLDISGLTDWDYFEVELELRPAAGMNARARKTVLYETYA